MNDKLLEIRRDFMLAHRDISFLTFGCDVYQGIKWRVSCGVNWGDLAHVHDCDNLGNGLEEALRRATFNANTGSK